MARYYLGLFVNNCMFSKENVKRRHAAVIALVGWYLMAPPVGSLRSTRNSSTGFYDAYSTLPFGAWEMTSSYDTAAECRTALDKANQLAKQGLSPLLCDRGVHRDQRSAP